MKINLGIDFGGSNLTIYKKGEGIIFKEPALICVKKQNDKYSIIALGKNAQDLQINNNENLVVFSPVIDGLVKSVEYAGSLIKYALNKILVASILYKINCKIAVPCGLNENEKSKYASACNFAGIKNVESMNCPVLAKFGANQGAIKGASLVVDIGGSKTDIAVMVRDEILDGATLALGGKTIDKAILSMLEEDNFIITEQTAEEIKIELATLYPNDTRKLIVNGIDKISEDIYPRTITAKETYPIIKGFFDEIVLIIKSCIHDSLPKLNGASIDEIIVTGGLCEIAGIKHFLTKYLGKNVYISENGENSVCLGFYSKLS